MDKRFKYIKQAKHPVMPSENNECQNISDGIEPESSQRVHAEGMHPTQGFGVLCRLRLATLAMICSFIKTYK